LTSGGNAEKLSGYPHPDGHGNGVEAALSGLARLRSHALTQMSQPDP